MQALGYEGELFLKYEEGNKESKKLLKKGKHYFQIGSSTSPIR